MVDKVLDFDSTKKFLDNIDENAYLLLKKWMKNPQINNDEKIAELYGQKVTVVRSILNKLSFRGIVTYNKVKDKNSGWYDYYWKIDFHKLAKLMYAEHKTNKEKMQEKMNMGENYEFFACKNNCNLFPFEVSAEYNFTCPECNSKLEYYDYSKKIKEMKGYVKTIKEEMNYILNALNKD